MNRIEVGLPCDQENIHLTEELFRGTIAGLPELLPLSKTIVDQLCPKLFWFAPISNITHTPWPVAGPLANNPSCINKLDKISLPFSSGITQYLPENSRNVNGLMCLPIDKFNRFRDASQQKIIDTVKHLMWYISINLGYGLFVADVFDCQPCPVSPKRQK